MALMINAQAEGVDLPAPSAYPEPKYKKLINQ